MLKYGHASHYHWTVSPVENHTPNNWLIKTMVKISCAKMIIGSVLISSRHHLNQCLCNRFGCHILEQAKTLCHDRPSQAAFSELKLYYLTLAQSVEFKTFVKHRQCSTHSNGCAHGGVAH